MFNTIEERGARSAAMQLDRWITINRSTYKVEESIEMYSKHLNLYVEGLAISHSTTSALIWAAHTLLIKVRW